MAFNNLYRQSIPFFIADFERHLANHKDVGVEGSTKNIIVKCQYTNNIAR